MSQAELSPADLPEHRDLQGHIGNVIGGIGAWCKEKIGAIGFGAESKMNRLCCKEFGLRQKIDDINKKMESRIDSLRRDAFARMDPANPTIKEMSDGEYQEHIDHIKHLMSEDITGIRNEFDGLKKSVWAQHSEVMAELEVVCAGSAKMSAYLEEVKTLLEELDKSDKHSRTAQLMMNQWYTKEDSSASTQSTSV